MSRQISTQVCYHEQLPSSIKSSQLFSLAHPKKTFCPADIRPSPVPVLSLHTHIHTLDTHIHVYIYRCSVRRHRSTYVPSEDSKGQAPATYLFLPGAQKHWQTWGCTYRSVEVTGLRDSGTYTRKPRIYTTQRERERHAESRKNGASLLGR